MPKLSDEEIIKKPVVYFLFGEEEDKDAVYIGEAEDGYVRLKQHLSDASRDFFNEVILFSSKDNNLTKAHIKYLESRLIQLAKNANRFDVKNGNVPVPSTLPLAAIDSMEDFIDDIKVVFDALRYKVLEPLIEIKSTNVAIQSTDDIKLFIDVPKKNILASGILTNDGIVVLKGTKMNINSVKSF